jgi:hypothetical protein
MTTNDKDELDTDERDDRPIDAMLEIVHWVLDRALDGTRDVGDVLAVERVRASTCAAILGDHAVVDRASELDALRTVACALAAFETRYGVSNLSCSLASTVDALSEAIAAELERGPLLAPHAYCVP